MAVTGITDKPQVVKYGGAEERRFSYVDGGTFEMGDLIRITTAGEIKVAAVNTDTAGAVHGIVLATVDTEVNEDVPVLLFANDTIVAIQCVDTVAPEDLSKGSTYTLETSSGTWGITSTTTKGIATVDDYAATGTPWKDRTGVYGQDITVNNNKVLVKFAQSILDGRAA